MQKINLRIMLISTLLAITACSSGQIKQEQMEQMEQGSYTPKVGEYGKQLVTSITLTSEQIDLLNSEQLPKPYKQLSEEQKLTIDFPASHELNPYRVVILTHGTAQRNGEVEVSFAGVLNRTKATANDLPTVQLYREEDSNDYRVSQKLVLAVTSEPFSFPLATKDEPYQIKTGLTKRDNFHFDSVVIQVWQGVGEKRSQYSYGKLIVSILLVGLLIYRMSFARL